MGRTIRAITILQPWAWAVVRGYKRFENREWETEYVGPVVIHAGKGDAWMGRGMPFLRKLGVEPLVSQLEFGALLGVADLVDCKRVAECGGDPHAFGPYCFELANPRPLERPVPWRGQLQLWRLDVDEVPGLAGLLGPAEAREATTPAESKDAKIERAIAAAGPGKLRRAAQRDLWK